MDTPQDSLRSDARCPSCGAPLAPEASSCAVCGREIAQAPTPAVVLTPAGQTANVAPVPADTADPVAPPAPASLVETPSTVAAVGLTAVPPAETPPGQIAAEAAQAAQAAQKAEPSASDAPRTGNLRVCEWCGAANPASAQRCEKCGASFPRPEQDDLLTRASAERVRLAMNEIEMHERLRAPWWKRLFGSKAT